MKKPERLYCYVCGKTLDLTKFCLVTMRDETDRVFLSCTGICQEQVETESHILVVGETQ